MKIYKLMPRNPDSKVWEGSDFKGALIVRAEESDNALRMQKKRQEEVRNMSARCK